MMAEEMENMEAMEIAKRYAVVRANLIAQGLFEETDVGMHITPSGKIRARKMWMALPDEEKLLYSWLTRALYKQGKL